MARRSECISFLFYISVLLLFTYENKQQQQQKQQSVGDEADLGALYLSRNEGSSSLFASAYRILSINASTPKSAYFVPYDPGFVGRFGDPTNLQRERINEGAFETATHELLYEGPSPRQACPGMVGPFSDGNYYCTAREYGYCDKRSGTCFCNTGYVGIDCSQCHGSHFLLGSLCIPKKLCPSDCSGAGTCNFFNGTCTCFPNRQGTACEIKLCSSHSPLCEACTIDGCLACQGGYYLTGDARVCSSCYDFDPRCAGCTANLGCTVCADPLLTSVRRSGYRLADPLLPIEENTRELSIALPFGTKYPDAFAEAEYYLVTQSPPNPLVFSSFTPLKNASQTCSQGLTLDDSWQCSPFKASHIVCGHYGVFKFAYPNFEIPESTPTGIRLSVSRSGGGYGNVSVTYYIKHFTTNFSDLSATAIYTTSQTLVFEDGDVERTFLINIQDDNLVEENEVFQVVLETPEGGGSVGPQFRANVTIIDDDAVRFSASASSIVASTTVVGAGATFSATIQATAANGINMTMGGERIYAVVENDLKKWANPGTPSQSMRHSLKKLCNVTDLGTGQYVASSNGIVEQGLYQMRLYHAFFNGLKGEYYSDGFFSPNSLVMSRIDRVVNFTWGLGKLTPHATDYVSIRWSGAIRSSLSDTYNFHVDADDHARLWVDGDLLIDHWHEQLAYLEPSRSVYLSKGVLYEVVMEYQEVRGPAHARLMWSSTKKPKMAVIPVTNLYSLWEINGSPLQIQIVSGATNALMSECTGQGLFTATANHQSTFQVCPRDVNLNMRDDVDEAYLASELFSANMSLTCEGPSCQQYIQSNHTLTRDLLRMMEDSAGGQAETVVPTLTYDHALHCFIGKYTVGRSGIYRLDIFYSPWFFVSQNHVAGSPFQVMVNHDKTNGPNSRVYMLHQPLYAEAGSCYNFTIIARDTLKNLVLTGGDQFEVYTYQVDYAVNIPDQGAAELLPHPSIQPTGQPTSMPTGHPTSAVKALTGNFRSSPALETPNAVVRYGTIYDRNNGNYTVEICPVIQGTHEIHILLNAVGVSNQPFRILDKQHSYHQAMGKNTYQGQYVDKSPYTMIVSHSKANAITSTAQGAGLVNATVGIVSSIIVTVRDAYDNVHRVTKFRPCNVTASLMRSPSANVSVWNFRNGSYSIDYVPTLAGSNLISILVNGFHIFGSPFTVPVADGRTSEQYSYAIGPGLGIGEAGVVSYFQIFAFDFHNNRKSSLNDVYQFRVSTGNNISTHVATPCPKPPIPNHPICDPYDVLYGHYYGQYTPLLEGISVVSINLYNATHGAGTKPITSHLAGSPYQVSVVPTSPKAIYTNITGDALYDNVAGVTATLNLQLRDRFGNRLISGGYQIEFVLLGVAVEWGTIEPWGTTPGLQDAYHYRGFFAGFPNVYGTVMDYGDGTYSVSHAATAAGQYVSRFAIAEPGLNATYFNTTDFGYLSNNDFNLAGFSDTFDGRPVNLGSTISWTGDIGGPHGAMGSLGGGSYYHMFESRNEAQINFNLSVSNANRMLGYANETESAFTRKEKFREQYWSARWTGLIAPMYAETYTFSVNMDSSSDVRLYIGGVGTAINGTTPGLLVLNISAGLSRAGSLTGAGEVGVGSKNSRIALAHQHVNSTPNSEAHSGAAAGSESFSFTSGQLPETFVGQFNFTDLLTREIVLEYVHYDEKSWLQLMWESPSTPLSIVPASAFSHWKNISHVNTTIHPAALSPIDSTAYGDALIHGVVGTLHSFVVYSRDQFGNLLQKGGDVPSMVAIGPDGEQFRGNVTDYGNSTYLIEYWATVSGDFMMYVTIGCCPPHPNVGIAAEVEMFRSMGLLIKGAPFFLTIQPNEALLSRTVAIGAGILGGVAGQMMSFSFQFRDLHNNPTNLLFSHSSAANARIALRFVDASNPSVSVTSGNLVLPAATSLPILSSTSFTSPVLYQMNRAGDYHMHVTFTSQVSSISSGEIDGSPFLTTISPAKANAANTICRGVGLKQASLLRSASFEVQLFDEFQNNLITGGNKLHVRLVGDAAFRVTQTVTPLCQDTRNGRYICTYSPVHLGAHRIHILLLNSSTTRTGGLGLTGRYYASPTAPPPPPPTPLALSSLAAAGNDDSAALILRDGEDATPLATQIDASISMSWPNGVILPSPENSTGISFSSDGAAARSNGQSVRWDGFLVPPRTDNFTLALRLNRMHGTIYIDSVLVFDSKNNIAWPIELMADSAYAIVVEASVASLLGSSAIIAKSPVSIDLVWSTPYVQKSIVPAFYLYDSAQEIALSPFPVTVA